MENAKQILSELTGRIQAGDVDGGMVTLSKIKVRVLCYSLSESNLCMNDAQHELKHP